MRFGLATLLVLLNAGAALADEARGCDAFKWPVAAEAKILSGSVPAVENGAEVMPGPGPHAIKLKPLAEAGLATPPERIRGGETPRAAFVRLPAPPVSGSVQVTLNNAAWLDLVQEGHTVRPTAFSDAADCPGVRKTLRFVIEARPVALQFSGSGMDEVRFIVASPQP